MNARIGVIGSCMVDLVTTIRRMPDAGETLEAPRFALGHGGKGANQAVAAARLGAAVTMVGCVGDDLFADGTLGNFAHLDIDAGHVRRVPGMTSGVAPIFVDENGENRILIVKGANADLAPSDVDAAAPALLTCDLILLQLEIPLDTVYYAIDWARRHGRRIILNPAPAVPDLALDRLVGVDFFMPNQTELAILTGHRADTPEDAAAAARHLLAHGISTVVVTLGAHGALLVNAEQTRLIPPVHVAVRDTTGAGDAFIGAFAAHYASGTPLVESLTRAARYAAMSVTAEGTQTSFPTYEAFVEFCANLDGPPAR
ncbi:ribokinase [Ameyamaea chiangmaiensis NBRC 103196]|uniref:Deoxyribokinase n=1 Tax=Ameyamaea chiangmaiensis TaxID=442969 RepID=A0A850P5P1_9PROT|nr:ribokinase [Ameyamaea chiangmaiensis]MBS4074136.1 ribokinase [Ameyamaea chiangmaiensis]NVN39947.1 ribokinase [Ameyamaea chiangmaiensis]GBQ71004.1 ribokinase [Ameyamaea chiangmaiensis NBRC 103196]